MRANCTSMVWKSKSFPASSSILEIVAGLKVR